MTEYVTREHLKFFSDTLIKTIKKQHDYIYRRLDDMDLRMHKMELALADFQEQLEDMDHMIEAIDWDVYSLKKLKK